MSKTYFCGIVIENGSFFTQSTLDYLKAINNSSLNFQTLYKDGRSPKSTNKNSPSISSYMKNAIILNIGSTYTTYLQSLQSLNSGIKTLFQNYLYLLFEVGTFNSTNISNCCSAINTFLNNNNFEDAKIKGSHLRGYIHGKFSNVSAESDVLIQTYDAIHDATVYYINFLKNSLNNISEQLQDFPSWSDICYDMLALYTLINQNSF